MKGYLLDTSVIIDFLRRTDKKHTLLFQLSEKDCSISIVTHTELFAGKSIWEHKRARTELETLFSGFTIIALDTAISQQAGHLKASHHDINLLDCIIAATAIYNDLTLVTLNVKDFTSIKDIRLYSPASS